MAAKTKPRKTTRKKTKPTTSTTPAESVHPGVKAAPTPVPATINDVREDEAAVLGHFVDVVTGPHKGRYGVFMEAGSNGTAVIRTRDDASERLSLKVSDLRPAKAGRR